MATQKHKRKPAYVLDEMVKLTARLLVGGEILGHLARQSAGGVVPPVDGNDSWPGSSEAAQPCACAARFSDAHQIPVKGHAWFPGPVPGAGRLHQASPSG